MTKDQVHEVLALYDKVEELSPELARCINTLGQGTPTEMKALQHPLVYDVPYFGQGNAFLNAQLVYKKEHIKKAVKNRQWSKFIDLHERPYRWQALHSIVQRHRLSGPAIAELFSFVWVDSENIWQNRVAIDYLVKKVQQHQFNLMPKEDYEVFRFLPNSFTAWRGCSERNRLGMSWTLNIERARWFSKRLLQPGDNPLVRTKVFQLADVLFYTNDKHEEEIVLKRRQ